MTDVLLAHSNHIYNDWKQVEKMQPYPPLQTLLAASSLREAGFTVALCDVTFDDPETLFDGLLHANAPRTVVVCEDDFNFLSKMCLSRNRELAFSMAKAARATGAVVAVHGPDSSDHVAAYLDAGFDYVLVGEIESTIVELAEGRPIADIPGVAFRCSSTGQVRYTRPRPIRSNLDALPRAAWDLVDMNRYRTAWMSAHGYFSLSMVSSRGCPFRCNWCAKPTYGDRYHVRSAWQIAEEMLYLKQEFGVEHIWFADDIFALSSTWAAEFAKAVEALDARIPFKMQSRCDLMIRDTVQALKRAGCAEVWMGAESGSQRVLDAMDKGIRVEQVYRARRNLSNNGIRACFFLQFGYPGEGWDEIMATVKMVRETKPDDVGVSVSYPLPGTKFFNVVASQLGSKMNWTNSGELSMMFRGTYPTAFYQELAEAIRLEVRHPSKHDQIRESWVKVGELRELSEAPGALV